MPKKVIPSVSDSKLTYNSMFVMAALSLVSMNSGNVVQAATTNDVSKIDQPSVCSSNSTRRGNSKRYSVDRLRINKKKLLNIKNLKSNWNGYNGEKIDESIIEITERLISTLDFQPQIFPTGRGTLQIEYYFDDDNLIEIEISNNEIFMYKIEEGQDIEKVIDLDEVSQVVSNFHA